MRKLSNFKDVGAGDVLLVVQPYTPKGTTKSVVWRWFGVVKDLGKRTHNIRLRRLGAPAAISVRVLAFGDIAYNNFQVFFLEPEEWPDGVHVFRTQMILKGEIDLD